MNRIIRIIQKDYKLALRDSIILYLIIGPLLLALAVRLFLPNIEDVKLNFIVDEGIGNKYSEQLKAYGHVEVESKENVYDRVNKNDAVPGVVLENEKPKIIFEGNEPQELINSYSVIFEMVFNENNEYNITSKNLSDKKPMLYSLMSTIILMTALFLGGTVSGFNIVAEKNTNAIRSMSVTPLKMRTYLFSRGFVAVITSIVIGILSALILSGTSIDYQKLIISLICASPLVVIITLLIGRMADNQINTIAAIKLIMPVYLTLPLASLLIPQRFLFILYPLPNFWAFQCSQHIFYSEGSINDFYTANIILFALGTIILLFLSKISKKHFGLR